MLHNQHYCVGNIIVLPMIGCNADLYSNLHVKIKLIMSPSKVEYLQ